MNKGSELVAGSKEMADILVNLSASIFTVEDTANITEITNGLISNNEEESVMIPITRLQNLTGLKDKQITRTQWPASKVFKGNGCNIGLIFSNLG